MEGAVLKGKVDGDVKAIFCDMVLVSVGSDWLISPIIVVS
jgi:hypothetical protein